MQDSVQRIHIILYFYCSFLNIRHANKDNNVHMLWKRKKAASILKQDQNTHQVEKNTDFDDTKQKSRTKMTAYSMTCTGQDR